MHTLSDTLVLLCIFLSAAGCLGSSCPMDETSLIQTKMVLEHGNGELNAEKIATDGRAANETNSSNTTRTNSSDAASANKTNSSDAASANKTNSSDTTSANEKTCRPYGSKNEEASYVMVEDGTSPFYKVWYPGQDDDGNLHMTAAGQGSCWKLWNPWRDNWKGKWKKTPNYEWPPNPDAFFDWLPSASCDFNWLSGGWGGADDRAYPWWPANKHKWWEKKKWWNWHNDATDVPAPALLGYDLTILNECNQLTGKPPISSGDFEYLWNTDRAGLTRTLTTTCAAARRNILRIWPWDMCWDMYWLVCGLQGKLPGQKGREIQFASAPGDLDITLFTDPPPFNTSARVDGVKMDWWQEPSGQLTPWPIYYAELTVVNFVCKNSGDLWRVGPGEPYECDFDQKAYHALGSAIRDGKGLSPMQMLQCKKNASSST